MTDVIIVVNSGSSSLKFALYAVGNPAGGPLLRGKVMGIGRKPELVAAIGDDVIEVTAPLNDIPVEATHEWLIEQLLERLTNRYTAFNPVAAGHRVVHGGEEFTGPVIIDPTVRRKLEAFVPLAPLHQQHNLAAIDAISNVMPDLVQVGCFDTSFHTTRPRLEKTFAIPRALSNEGIIAYGFHGLSYEYIARTLPTYLGDEANGRAVVAHLGNGASMCGMKDRQSMAISMGFSTLDGLMMGSRCGALDAGVVLHLLQSKGMTPDEVQHLLYRESGLRGVSGISNNMQVLLESGAPHAQEAIDLFCYRAACELGSLATAMQGLDVIVFTAGIGEKAAPVRQLICAQLSWLGVDLDPTANNQNASVISAESSKIKVLVIATDEEQIIAESTASLV